MNTIRTKLPEDKGLLEGLLRSDASAIRQIYDLVLPTIIVWVKENQGSQEDARDIFQEGLIALFRRLQKGDFELSCTLKSYLRIVCRNLWLTRLRDRSKVELQGEEELAAVELDGSILEQIEQSEREQLFFKHFDGLGENCRKILQWFFDKIPLAKIAEKLDTSENYIKKRKFICKERLIKAIREDARFSELK